MTDARSGSNRRIIALTTVLALALAVFVVGRLQLTEPYRPGTTHRVTVDLNGCDRPSPLTLDDRTWSSHDKLPRGWPNPPMSASTFSHVPGTLEVIATDDAVFTADIGGTVRFQRLAPHAFDDLSCPIE